MYTTENCCDMSNVDGFDGNVEDILFLKRLIEVIKKNWIERVK